MKDERSKSGGKLWCLCLMVGVGAAWSGCSSNANTLSNGAAGQQSGESGGPCTGRVAVLKDASLRRYTPGSFSPGALDGTRVGGVPQGRELEILDACQPGETYLGRNDKKALWHLVHVPPQGAGLWYEQQWQSENPDAAHRKAWVAADFLGCSCDKTNTQLAHSAESNSLGPRPALTVDANGVATRATVEGDKIRLTRIQNDRVELEVELDAGLQRPVISAGILDAFATQERAGLGWSIDEVQHAIETLKQRLSAWDQPAPEDQELHDRVGTLLSIQYSQSVSSSQLASDLELIRAAMEELDKVLETHTAGAGTDEELPPYAASVDAVQGALSNLSQVIEYGFLMSVRSIEDVEKLARSAASAPLAVDSVDYHPATGGLSAATDAAGNVYVAWATYTGAIHREGLFDGLRVYSALRAAKFDVISKSWQGPVTLQKYEGKEAVRYFLAEPEVAANDDETGVAYRIDDDQASVRTARFRYAGLSGAAGIAGAQHHNVVERATGGANLRLRGDGNTFGLCWSERRDFVAEDGEETYASGIVCYRKKSGIRWELVTSESGDSFLNDLSAPGTDGPTMDMDIDAHGTLTVAWRTRGEQDAVWAARCEANARCTRTEMTEPENQTEVRLAMVRMSHDGFALVLWEGYPHGDYSQAAVFEERRYLRSAGRWSELRQTDRIGDDTETWNRFKLAMDRDTGRATLVWPRGPLQSREKKLVLSRLEGPDAEWERPFELESAPQGYSDPIVARNSSRAYVVYGVQDENYETTWWSRPSVIDEARN